MTWASELHQRSIDFWNGRASRLAIGTRDKTEAYRSNNTANDSSDQKVLVPHGASD